MKTISSYTKAESLIKEQFEHYDKSESFKLSEVFLDKGFILPKPQGFNLDNFGEKFVTALNNAGFSKVEVQPEANQLLTINFKKKLFLGLFNKKDSFFLAEAEDYLVYTLKSAAESSGTSGFFGSKTKKFLSVFTDKLREEQALLGENIEGARHNVLMRKLDAFKELSILFLAEKNEVILAALPIKSVKFESDSQQADVKKYYYILSDKDAALTGFNEDSRLVFMKKIGDSPLKIQGFWLWKTVKCGIDRWYPSKGSISYFEKIINLNTADSETRIKTASVINYEKGRLPLADALAALLANRTGDPFYELTRIFIDFINHKAVFPDSEKRRQFFEHLRNALSGLMSKDKYQFFLMNYKMTHKERAVFLEFMLKTARNIDQYKNGLPVAEMIFEDYQKKCKHKYRKLIVSILYAKYLILAKEYKTAEKLIGSIEKQLPEEELSLLMPKRTTDPASKEAGQYMLTELYEMLREARPKKADYYIRQLAEIQPLNLKRLKALAESQNKNNKAAGQLLSLLNGESAPAAENASPLPAQYKSLKSKVINNSLKHPAERPKGSMSYVKKWLKHNDTRNYDTIKSFAKPLDSEKYSEISEIIRSTASALNLQKTEIFIAEGEMGDHIIAYEASPPFVVIGSKLLQAPLGKIAFLAGNQLGHVALGHSPVSSKVAWQSFARHGALTAENLAQSINMGGLSDQSLKAVETINEITQVLSRTDSDTNSPENVEAGAAELYRFMKKPVTHDHYKKSISRLTVAGRLLQASADRAGLLFAPDLKTACYTIAEQSVGKQAQTGENMLLKDYLTAKNNDGSYRYPEVIVRIMNLFSFYLSDDYRNLKKAIKK